MEPASSRFEVFIAFEKRSAASAFLQGTQPPHGAVPIERESSRPLDCRQVGQGFEVYARFDDGLLAEDFWLVAASVGAEIRRIPLEAS